MFTPLCVCWQRSLRSSEAGWMRGCVCVCVCCEGGGSQDKRARQCCRGTNCPPKKVGHCTAHAHLCFVMEKPRQGGAGRRTCVSRGEADSPGGLHATPFSQGISSVSGGVFICVYVSVCVCVLGHCP